MAYFERADETDKLVLCNICNVKCAERSITHHKSKCALKPQHAIKFEKGSIEKCRYDTSHIIIGGMMDIHLEFCTKRQSQLVGEYQIATKAMESAALPESGEDVDLQTNTETVTNDDGWNIEEVANSKNLVCEMGSLNIR